MHIGDDMTMVVGDDLSHRIPGENLLSVDDTWYLDDLAHLTLQFGL